MAARKRGRCDAQALYHEAVAELIERLAGIKRPFLRVAEIGGWDYRLLEHLKNQNPAREVLKINLAGHTPTHASIPSLVCDGEVLPLAPGRFDLIISTLALHRANDVPGVLAQMHNALAPDGLMLGVFLGGETLHELRECLQAAELEIHKGAGAHLHPVIDLPSAAALMQRAHYALPVIDHTRLTLVYDDILHLAHDVRAMGEGNALPAQTPLTRSVLARASEIYAEWFGDGAGLPATFDLIFLSGWRPHDSQQKPLKPGEATLRLADALRTKETTAGETVPFPRGPRDINNKV